MLVNGLSENQIRERVIELFNLFQEIEKEKMENKIIEEYMKNPDFKKEIDAKLGIENDNCDDDEKI